MEENPFPDLKIDSSDFLDSVGGRSKCPKCQRSRKYYCYTCYVPVPEIKERVPAVKLPLKVDIIKHPSEVDGKSTAVHAGVIAPDDVNIYTYPCIPDYEDRTKVLLVFPGESSCTLADLSQKWNTQKPRETAENGVKRKADDIDEVVPSFPLKTAKLENGKEKSCNVVNTVSKAQNVQSGSQSSVEISDEGTVDDQTNVTDDSIQTDTSLHDEGSARNGKIDSINRNTSDSINRNTSGVALRIPSCSIERVVFIDSTWNQTKNICTDERLKGLQCIELKTRDTKFWRHQKDIPNTYLSTIEAIYYFLRDFHEQFIPSEYTGEYDNLLFFFKFMHRKIRTLYNGGEDLKAYQQRK